MLNSCDSLLQLFLPSPPSPFGMITQDPELSNQGEWRRSLRSLSNEKHRKHRIWKPEVLETIDERIQGLSESLYQLSIDISDHPELAFHEYHARNVLTEFIKRHDHGFEVMTDQFENLPTAWSATFSHGESGPTIGVNSEMDALPEIGHACGHNLIAIAGVATALSLAHAMRKHDIPGKVFLLGTPAEESGQGKVLLYKQGAYDGVDACLMCHPAPGPERSVSLSSSLATSKIEVKYTGKTAHAANSPWEGINALDACVLAYNGISALRQQLRPTDRVHGIFSGNNWAPNVIPDNANMLYIVRAPSWDAKEDLLRRAMPCFEAAATATKCLCEAKITPGFYELLQNKTLGDELSIIIHDYYGGEIDYEYGISSASTDFGNISQLIPSLHPGVAIPTKPDGGNHTREFQQSARTPEAHEATLVVASSLAALGARMCDDNEFLQKVKASFQKDFKRDHRALQSL